MSKKKKLTEVTGKEETFVPTRLEQVWGGFNELALYGTKNEFEYKKLIDNMSRQELEAHASKVGIVPNEDTDKLLKLLVKEFRIYNQTLYKPVLNATDPENIPDHIKKILAQVTNV
jgi:hypothetical protein